MTTPTPGAVTQLVVGLRTVGPVESVPKPHDRRSRHLRPTDAERRRVAEIEAGVARRPAPSLEALNDAELPALAGVLEKAGEQR